MVISVPSGEATDDLIQQLAGILSPGDVIVDAGNSNFRDSQRRAAELEAKGLDWLDMGVSGGIWGLQVGFCAMLGGKREVFDRFEPAVRDLAPEGGYLYCGPAGAGHYVKMVHNGIEYGIMQAYGEGFDILHASDYDLDLAAIARMWQQGSVIRSWLLELAGDAFTREGNDLEQDQGLGRRLWRGPLDGGRSDRPRRARARHHPVADRALPQPARAGLASPIGSWPRCATSSAGTR